MISSIAEATIAIRQFAAATGIDIIKTTKSKITQPKVPRERFHEAVVPV